MLSWNLFHGRAVPPAGRSLAAEFEAALAGWRWDVALLQEVPPWWPPALARAGGAVERHVLTSRNGALALRRAIASRRPDWIRSNGGGANAILVRGGLAVTEHRSVLLRRFPERRRLHAIRLASGWWIGNLHAQGSAAEAVRAARTIAGWAGATAPLVLGGDFNLAEPALPGLQRAGGHGVDQVWTTGWRAVAAEVLDRGRLSDHAPVRVTLAPPS